MQSDFFGDSVRMRFVLFLGVKGITMSYREYQRRVSSRFIAL